MPKHRALNIIGKTISDLIRKKVKTDWEIIDIDPKNYDDSIFEKPFEVILGLNPPLEILEKVNGVKYNISQSTGVDWFNKEYYKQRGIILVNCHAQARSVAEHAFALLLDQAKRISVSDREIRKLDGKWPDKEFNTIAGLTLNNKNLISLGTGKIGQYIAKYAKAFGMHTIGVRRRNKPVEYFDEIYTIEELDNILPKADFIICSLPLTEETKNLINLSKFKLMKKSAIFVNVGRGGVVEEESLYLALKEHIIRGAGIDVVYRYPWLEKEKPHMIANYPFHTLDNITITPHRAWNTDEIDDAIATDLAYKLDLIAKGEKVPDIVNLDAGY